jgi:hypothetical protein
MKQNIIHIGLDVDDTQYHGSAFNKNTGEVIGMFSIVGQSFVAGFPAKQTTRQTKNTTMRQVRCKSWGHPPISRLRSN